MLKANISSIETFGTVDGPGIRFVIFFQGCPLRCLYCHNPETWNNSIHIEMTIDDILQQYLSKENFYQKGGITCSGGEPLLQIDFIIELFKECKKYNIHTCIDTSGITFDTSKFYLNKMEKLLLYTDLFIIDLKNLDKKKHIELTTKSNKNVLDFIRYIESKNKIFWIRQVVVPNINDNEKNILNLSIYLSGFKNLTRIELLPYHTLGEIKYDKLNIDYPLKNIQNLSKEKLQLLTKLLKKEIENINKL